jgi:hypothetical protein
MGIRLATLTIMEWTPMKKARATSIVSWLLGGLGLERYSFLVRPRAAHCDVLVEYASTAGWKVVTLTLDASRLLAAASEEDVARGLTAVIRGKLKLASYTASAMEARRAEGIALGNAWAIDRANELRGVVEPADWPDFWDDADAGLLPEELSESERREVYELATRVARERWIELVADARLDDALEENAEEVEARAADLETRLRESLPPDIAVGRDASRVFVVLPGTGRSERTVASLQEAWLVLQELEADCQASG